MSIYKENDVKLPSTPSVEEIAETPEESETPTEPETELEQTEEVPPAKPAPQAIPYERFREVNDKAKSLEEELKKIRESSVSSEEPPALDWEMMSDNEKWMAKELIKIKEDQLWKEDLDKVKKSFPQLGEREAEFKEYAYKYPKSVGIDVLAKSFLFENKPEKPVEPESKTATKGLERPTGGTRQVPSPGMTLADIKRLREEQPKLYEKMIRENKFPKVIPEK